MIYVDNRVKIFCLIVSMITCNTLKMAAIFFNCLQNDGCNGLLYSAILFSDIYGQQNPYIQSTSKPLRFLVSEIDVLLWKWSPFF